MNSIDFAVWVALFAAFSTLVSTLLNSFLTYKKIKSSEKIELKRMEIEHLKAIDEIKLTHDNGLDDHRIAMTYNEKKLLFIDFITYANNYIKCGLDLDKLEIVHSKISLLCERNVVSRCDMFMKFIQRKDNESSLPPQLNQCIFMMKDELESLLGQPNRRFENKDKND